MTDYDQYSDPTAAAAQYGGAPAAPAPVAKPPMPTSNPGVGYKWVYVPATNSWEVQGASAKETMDQNLAQSRGQSPAGQAPVVPYANAGASAAPQTNAQVASQQPQWGAHYQETPEQAATAAGQGAAPVGSGGPKPTGGVIGYDPGYTRVDRTAYDQAAQGYDRAVSTFQSELDRLSGVDPFGNQAFLRQATDRAAAQAGGLAAGGLSTATARAGNMRQAQGVQAQMSAQGRDQATIQRAQDEQAAAGLRLNAAGGLANTLGAKATNEIELAKIDTQTGIANMDAYLKKYGIDTQVKQQDIENLRNVNVELQKLGEQARESDVDALLKKYGIDQNTQVALKQIAQSGKLTMKDVVGGIFGAGAAVAGGLAMKSDIRSKFDIRDPDLRDLEDFLGRTKGKLYRYKQPNAPGQRAGLNYGPMAQDLAKSKIGKTVVVEGADGLYVDTGRLALADHAALSALAAEVKAIRDAAKGSKS